MSEETNSVRCLAAYNKTLLGGKFERGRSVWIDPAGVRLLCSLLLLFLNVLLLYECSFCSFLLLYEYRLVRC